MSNDLHTDDNAGGRFSAKYIHTMGALNISLAVILFIDGILIGAMSLCCLLMSFSLFFMAAIPAFFVTGALCAIAIIAAIANLIAGIGTIAASRKGGVAAIIFSVVSIVVDVAVIPANITALACGVYLLATEISFLSILIFIIATAALAISATSLVLNVVRVAKSKKI